MENRNTIIALVLMLLVWSGFTYFFPPQRIQNDQKIDENQVVESDNEKNIISSQYDELIDENNNSTVNSDIIEKTFVVENNKFIAVFSTRGGTIISIKLKDYRLTNDSDSDLVTIIDSKFEVPSLLSLGTNSLAIDPNLYYSVDIVEDIVVENNKRILFKAETNSGLIVTKEYSFDVDTYNIGFNISLNNISESTLSGQVELSLQSFWEDSMEGNRLEFVGPVSYSLDELFTDDVEDIIEKPKKYTELIQWSGFEDKYFISSLIVPNSSDVSQLLISKNYKKITNTFILSPISLLPSQSKAFNFQLYYGPKDVNILANAGNKLYEAVDFGFFKILAKPLHVVLNFFNKYVGNYGVSIILLTIILKLIFWPLTQKSYVSMKAMQTLQPEMKKLREKYRNDKEGLNRKTMELYKENRVNPMGGCLPMLVQIPVFFALYKVLLGTIELRHSPFIFWITDLSVKDPYYITPVVMGLTMFIQQKLTPSTMDPMQAKMMMAMPIVFTFMFLNFPAGLVIYWLVNNLLTIFQQYLIYRKPAVIIAD
ncbi:MAG: membrane protein insertase YidC [Thermodesulfobacteriota bacterium]|nr:membrane protein insertase YidC [Thermodesulfobacteriota bacterium]